MQREEIFEGCKHIIAELEREIDTRISCDKKFVDDWNSKIKKVGNYKSKLIQYDSYPGVGMTMSQREIYSHFGPRSLGDLMEHKEEYLTDRFYAYVLSLYFPDRIAELSALRSKLLHKYAQPIYPIIGAVAGMLISPWLAAALGAVGLFAMTLVYKMTAKNAEPYTRILRAMESARSFVEGELRTMDEERKMRINILSTSFGRQRGESLIARRRRSTHL